MEYTKHNNMLRFTEPSGTQTIINLDNVLTIVPKGANTTTINFTAFKQTYAISFNQMYRMVFERPVSHIR